jgi:hypothetical protein
MQTKSNVSGSNLAPLSTSNNQFKDARQKMYEKTLLRHMSCVLYQ